MKSLMNYTGKIISATALGVVAMSIFFTQCKKDTETIIQTDTVYVDPNDTGIFVPGSANIDASWTFDKTHANVNWQSKYYDFSSTMLTGRFNNFNFNPPLSFSETNLAATQLDFWVQMSTYNTGEPGRDGLGKCGLNYLGIVFMDTLKTIVDPQSDTAKFHCNSITIDPHDGYIMHGTLTFNRYRAPSGYPDGTPIVKNMNVALSFNGMRDFDTNGDGVTDKFRAGLTATFKFNRSDFMDNASTKPYWPVPTVAEAITNTTTAANNKTYGVWSTSVSDEMEIVVNAVYYKNH